MSQLTAALPAWVAVVLGGIVLIMLILALVDLFVRPDPSRVKRMGDWCLVAVSRRARQTLRHLTKRAVTRRSSDCPPPGGLLDRFPVATMAVALLGVLISFVALSGLMLLRSTSEMGFREASLSRSTAPTGGATYATAVVGTIWDLRVTLNLSTEQMDGASVGVAGPPSITFNRCWAFGVSGPKASGYTRGSLGRVALGSLDATDTVTVECRFLVIHRVRAQEAVEVELTARSRTAEKKVLYLEPPDRVEGQEAAEALRDKEVRTSPALWERSSMVAKPGAFREQGEAWELLDPHYLHGFLSLPRGRTTTIRHLASTRVQPSRIVTLKGIVSSHPVTQERFRAEGSRRQAIRQVYAIGQRPDEQGGWCTTTRSTSQLPLRKGDRIKFKAAVIAWGKSGASDGFAVMLNCPGVKILGRMGDLASGSSTGAVAAPHGAATEAE